MKRRDVYTFRNGLELTAFTHMRLTFVVRENKTKANALIKSMEKEIDPNEAMSEFIKVREDLYKKHSFKDNKGEPKMTTIHREAPHLARLKYEIEGFDDPNSVYSKALAKLEKKYKETIAEHNEKVRIYNEEFLEDECDFKPTTVKLSLIEGKESCSQQIMDLIYPMIKLN